MVSGDLGGGGGGILRRFSGRLPAIGGEEAGRWAGLSLGEGGTPLVKLRRLPAEKGGAAAEEVEIWVKVEGMNPTGSFKDRGMAVAVAAAAADGVRCVICASTGNTSASAAAYAARAGMACVILLPEGRVAAGKVAQAVVGGAAMVRIGGNFDDAMAAVKEFADGGRVAVVNSINPMRLQGQKTAAFEVVEAMGAAPDFHALPVGNAGNITAHWIGYCEAVGRGTAACAWCGGACGLCGEGGGGEAGGGTPAMLGYQAAGAAPFVVGAPVARPETVATAIRIGNPQSFAAARTALSESGGWVGAVDDAEILAVQQGLARWEGVFCEPASAASVAGVLRDVRDGRVPAGARVVCTLTGHGLKDAEVGWVREALSRASAPVAVGELGAVIERYVDGAGGEAG